MDGQPVEERVSVARVTRAGVSLASIEETSSFPGLMASSRSGVKFVEHNKTETTAHFRGEFGAGFWPDFARLFEGRTTGRRYHLNFANVATVSPSGLAMLLTLESYNGGQKNDIRISHCNRKVYQSLSNLLVPGVALTLSTDDDEKENLHKFSYTLVTDEMGQDILTIGIARMFDYNCRNDFAKIYRGRIRKTQYVLDFQDTIHVGKAAFGTMLLLNQHNREYNGGIIRIIHCSPYIRGIFEGMKFERFFEFIE
ncbi:MAG: hypothetical protein HQL76_15320 [Magnetococcales bacterium]|nr:hypothetical protein [Magnetococcales bacterium]